MVTEDYQVAADMRARLAESIGQDRFELWFGPQTQFRFSECGLTVVAACTFTRDWLRRNFAGEVRACCQAVTGRDVRVEFDVDASLPPVSDGITTLPAPVQLPQEKAADAATAAATARPGRKRAGGVVPTGRAASKPSRRADALHDRGRQEQRIRVCVRQK